MVFETYVVLFHLLEHYLQLLKALACLSKQILALLGIGIDLNNFVLVTVVFILEILLGNFDLVQFLSNLWFSL